MTGPAAGVPEGLRLAAVTAALEKLREARNLLRDAGAMQAAEYVARAMKSVEGAQRHAEHRQVRAEEGRGMRGRRATRALAPGEQLERARSIAHAAGWDAGNRSAAAAGRSAWNEDDYNAAAAESTRVFPEEAEVALSERAGMAALAALQSGPGRER